MLRNFSYRSGRNLRSGKLGLCYDKGKWRLTLPVSLKKKGKLHYSAFLRTRKWHTADLTAVGVCVCGGGGRFAELQNANCCWFLRTGSSTPPLPAPVTRMFRFFSMISVNTFTNNYRKPSIIVMGKGGGSLQIVYVTGIPVEHKCFTHILLHEQTKFGNLYVVITVGLI